MCMEIKNFIADNLEHKIYAFFYFNAKKLYCLQKDKKCVLK